MPSKRPDADLDDAAARGMRPLEVRACAAYPHDFASVDFGKVTRLVAY